MAPLVSICCNTYNHERYVRSALDGFVNQKTDFEYEVLVYDDASNDNTPHIIKEYEKKYPELIKPVYQTVNQASRGLKPIRQNRERSKAKYVAVCEGDDYWVDEKKLQKQITYMEEHPDCTFCFTNARTEIEGVVEKQRMVPWNKYSKLKKGQTDFDFGELALLGFIPTATFVFRNGNVFPEMPDGAFTGDEYVKLAMTSYGYAHFIDEITAVYRRGVANSSTTLWENDTKRYDNNCNRYYLLYDGLKEFTDHKYDGQIDFLVCQLKIKQNYRKGDAKALREIVKSGEIKKLKCGNGYSRMVLGLKCRHYNMFNRIKRMLKKGKT